MRASAIRELASSKFSPLIAAAMFENYVQIWDSETQKKITEFPAVFCMGAANLAMSPSGQTLIAGQSKSRGKVAAYDVQSGLKIWAQEVVYPSRLNFVSSGKYVICTKNNKSVVVLDVTNGCVTKTIADASKYVEEPSTNESFAFVERQTSLIEIVGSTKILSIAKSGLTILDIQFNQDCFYLSEAGGLVRCINLIDGTSRWIFDPGKGRHITKLHFSFSKYCIFGVLRNFEKGGLRKLLRFHPATGANEVVCEFDSWNEVFLEIADQLITSAGEIRDLSNGAVIGQLDFPQMEYLES